MKKFIPLFLLVAAGLVHAEWKLNPYTQRQDYYEGKAGIAASTGTLTLGLAAEIARATARENAIAVSTGLINSALTSEIARATARENAIAVSTGSLDSAKVNRSGDTMTGALTVQSSVTATQAISASRFDISGSTALAVTANGSVFVGPLAGTLSTGLSNTFVGNQAGATNTSGVQNTFVGSSAGNANNGIGAFYNTYIGASAGIAAVGHDNVFIGKDAGFQVAGHDNVMIGSLAGDAITSGTGNILIGHDVDAPAATSSLLNIGNLLTGTIGGSSVTAQGTLYANAFSGPLTGSASLNVLKSGDTMSGPLTLAGSSLTVTGTGSNYFGGLLGINTTAPSARLDVHMSASDDYSLQVSSADGTTAQLWVTKVGRVGIAGVSNPLNALDVGGAVASVTSTPQFKFDDNAQQDWTLQTGDGNLHFIGAAEYVTMQTATGNVGIGTTAPTAKFVVNGNIVSSGTITLTGNIGISTSIPSGRLTVQNVAADAPGSYILKLSSANATNILGIHSNGHFSIGGYMSTVGTCANGAMVSNIGHDTAGRIAFTGANSTCEVVFGRAFDAVPVCVCTGYTGAGEGCQISAISASGFTMVPLNGAWDNGDGLAYHCFGGHS